MTIPTVKSAFIYMRDRPFDNAVKLAVYLHTMSQTDLGPALEKGIWAAVVIAAVIVILRIFGKIKINRFGVDDGLMIFAEVDLPG